MAVALDYQSVYVPKRTIKVSVRGQVIVAALLVLALVARVFIRNQMTDIGYELARERQRAMQIDMEKQEAKLQLSVLLRSDNLSEAASDKLALEPLNPSKTRKVKLNRGER